ncbi:hypothetical protein [Emticicia sp. SJ17W-69]|uniref:hypothetical protein n=1 Tax=Emticicia sp. SJ17W-69 TaxID=3421657 RepID=UPI003EC11A52
MQKLSSEIQSFISKNSETTIIQSHKGFIETPFDYLFLPEKKLLFHCISLDIEVIQPLFFQELSNFFAKKKIKLIHLWEDVWLSKQDIVKSRILSLLGKSETIPARLTQVRRIDKPTLDNFLTVNHLQGTVGAKLKYGLFLPERYFRVIDTNTTNQSITQSLNHSKELLVAVASFSNAKKIVREGKEFRSYELIRFANLKGFTIVGGLNKLLKNFIHEQNPDDIMTYADSDWSDGSNYEKIGFERIEQTPPLAFSIDNQTFMRNLISNPHSLPFSSEARAIIYNSGNWKFLMKLKHD